MALGSTVLRSYYSQLPKKDEWPAIPVFVTALPLFGACRICELPAQFDFRALPEAIFPVIEVCHDCQLDLVVRPPKLPPKTTRRRARYAAENIKAGHPRASSACFACGEAPVVLNGTICSKCAWLTVADDVRPLAIWVYQTISMRDVRSVVLRIFCDLRLAQMGLLGS